MAIWRILWHFSEEKRLDPLTFDSEEKANSYALYYSGLWKLHCHAQKLEQRFSSSQKKDVSSLSYEIMPRLTH
jgi:hypothetical protein